MYNRKSRYRFYSPQGVPPFAAESDDKKDDVVKNPRKAHTDSPDAPDDDLQNVDKSKGGYGGGSGFSPDRT